MSKPTSFEQADLITTVVNFVSKMIPSFNADDIVWVRALKAAKVAVFNVQCKSVPMAVNIKSVFASLVKQTKPPAYLGKVKLILCCYQNLRIPVEMLSSVFIY